MASSVSTAYAEAKSSVFPFLLRDLTVPKSFRGMVERDKNDFEVVTLPAGTWVFHGTDEAACPSSPSSFSSSSQHKHRSQADQVQPFWTSNPFVAKLYATTFLCGYQLQDSATFLYMHSRHNAKKLVKILKDFALLSYRLGFGLGLSEEQTEALISQKSQKSLESHPLGCAIKKELKEKHGISKQFGRCSWSPADMDVAQSLCSYMLEQKYGYAGYINKLVQSTYHDFFPPEIMWCFPFRHFKLVRQWTPLDRFDLSQLS